tara:strand:- start:1667 stop:1846 length:180 start_codon:yes stop_codon:yes gene_type:complete
MNITVKDEERFGAANKLLKIFCRDHVSGEPLTASWINNLKLVLGYATEVVELTEESINE